MMLWDMAMTLTAEADDLLKSIVHPCFAALGLANDYFSFDREFQEMRATKVTSLTNAVWLYMRWGSISLKPQTA